VNEREKRKNKDENEHMTKKKIIKINSDKIRREKTKRLAKECEKGRIKTKERETKGKRELNKGRKK
jgi:hypothetical protein